MLFPSRSGSLLLCCLISAAGQKVRERDFAAYSEPFEALFLSPAHTNQNGQCFSVCCCNPLFLHLGFSKEFLRIWASPSLLQVRLVIENLLQPLLLLLMLANWQTCRPPTLVITNNDQSGRKRRKKKLKKAKQIFSRRSNLAALFYCLGSDWVRLPLCLLVEAHKLHSWPPPPLPVVTNVEMRGKRAAAVFSSRALITGKTNTNGGLVNNGSGRGKTESDRVRVGNRSRNASTQRAFLLLCPFGVTCPAGCSAVCGLHTGGSCLQTFADSQSVDRDEWLRWIAAFLSGVFFLLLILLLAFLFSVGLIDIQMPFQLCSFAAAPTLEMTVFLLLLSCCCCWCIIYFNFFSSFTLFTLKRLFASWVRLKSSSAFTPAAFSPSSLPPLKMLFSMSQSLARHYRCFIEFQFEFFAFSLC